MNLNVRKIEKGVYKYISVPKQKIISLRYLEVDLQLVRLKIESPKRIEPSMHIPFLIAHVATIGTKTRKCSDRLLWQVVFMVSYLGATTAGGRVAACGVLWIRLKIRDPKLR